VPGGKDGRRRLVKACGRKLEVAVAADDPKKYPDGYDNCVVWFDERLTLSSSRDRLREKLGLCARRFFKVLKRGM
jgi:RNase H-fold protein (predicted Holliday junction resolvase)